MHSAILATASRRRLVLTVALAALATAVTLSLLATRSQAGTTSPALEVAVLKAQLANAERGAS